MIDIFIKDLKLEFDRAIEHFRTELAKVHTGRASAAIIEDLAIECYGSRTPLKALALITVTAPKELKIEAWDQSSVKAISDAIAKASLGSLPQVEGKVIRLNLPSMTSESREKMVRVVHDFSEKAKISLRASREKIWNEIQKLERDGRVREDEKFKAKDKIQELLNEYYKIVDELSGKKTGELKV